MDSRLFSNAEPAYYAEALSYPTGTAELAAEAEAARQEMLREAGGAKDLAPGESTSP